MILSSLITPFRIYSEPTDLDKFKRDCDNFEPFELITDKTRLLPFQFRRDVSPYPISFAWLRQECDMFYDELLPYATAHFVNNATWLYQYATLENGYGKLTAGANGYISQNALLTVGNKYRVKIVINEILNNNAMTLKVTNGIGFGNPSQVIDSAGTHIFEFTAVDAAILILSTITSTDYVKISEFSVFEISGYMNDANDYSIDPSNFQYLSVSGQDIILYCGSPFTNTLPCGKYYLIMQSKDRLNADEYFFSEVITIKDFVPTQSPYPFIEWYNTCDIQDVKYTTLDCNYKNRMYIDGPLAKPEYPFKEDVEKDANETEYPVFQKWEKTEVLTNPKSPEFIVDALTAMRLHDTIRFCPALRKKESQLDLTNGFIDVISMEYDVNYIFSDCAANVDLKLLLDEGIVDTACCTPITLTDGCIACTYTLEGLCANSENAKICPKDGGLPGYDFYLLDGETWVLTAPTLGTLICFNDETPSLYWNGSAWIHVPLLTALTNQTTTITITGTIYTGTVGQIVISNLTTSFTVPGYYSAAELAAGVVINKADLPAEFFETYMDVTIHNVTPKCDYGYSNVLSLSYGEGG